MINYVFIVTTRIKALVNIFSYYEHIIHVMVDTMVKLSLVCICTMDSVRITGNSDGEHVVLGTIEIYKLYINVEVKKNSDIR